MWGDIELQVGLLPYIHMSSNNRPQNGSGRPPRRNNNRNSNSARRGVPPRRNKPEPKLTLWQKFLKAIGLYKPAPAPQKSNKPGPKSGAQQKQGQQKPAAKKSAAKKKPARKAPPTKVDSARLYVGNLSYDVTESELIDLFKGFGAVKSAEVVYNKRTQRSKGFAFVQMVSIDDAKRAVEVLHEQPFMGRNMIVNGARTVDEERKAIQSPAQ